MTCRRRHHCQFDLAIAVIGTEAELRDVDNDRRPLDLGGCPAPTLQRQLDLLDAPAERNAQRAKGAGTDPSIDVESVALLESLDGVHERAVVRARGE